MHGGEVTSATNSSKGLDEIEFVSLLTGEDGRFLVVLYKLIHTAKTPLTDAVHSVLQLHLEVLVLPHSLQRNGEITRLGKKNKQKKTWSDKSVGHCCCCFSLSKHQMAALIQIKSDSALPYTTA